MKEVVLPFTVAKIVEGGVDEFELAMLRYRQSYEITSEDAFDRVVDEVREYLPKWKPPYKNVQSMSAARSRSRKK